MGRGVGGDVRELLRHARACDFILRYSKNFGFYSRCNGMLSEGFERKTCVTGYIKNILGCSEETGLQWSHAEGGISNKR